MSKLIEEYRQRRRIRQKAAKHTILKAVVIQYILSQFVKFVKL